VASPSPPARWPAESLPVCGCGCGERVRMPGALFRAGHRQRLGHVPPTCPDCGAPVAARGRRGWPCAVTARGPNPRRPKLTLRCRGPAARGCWSSDAATSRGCRSRGTRPRAPTCVGAIGSRRVRPTGGGHWAASRAAGLPHARVGTDSRRGRGPRDPTERARRNSDRGQRSRGASSPRADARGHCDMR
jgi:hypothetical protein